MILEDKYRKILTRLKVRLSQKIKNCPFMDRESFDQGEALEFADYQSYVWGDNVRHIDWDRYALESKLVVKKYHVYERPEVVLIPDMSASIEVGQKTDDVRKLSASLSHCMLDAGFVIKLVFNNAVVSRYAGVRDYSRLSHDIEFLEAGTYPFLSVSGQVVKNAANVLIVTDLVYHGLEHLRGNLLLSGIKCTIYRLESENDRNPEFCGNMRFRDVQVDKNIDTYVSYKVIKEYQNVRQEYFQEAREYCSRQGWRMCDIDIDQSFLKQLDRIAPQGVIVI